MDFIAIVILIIVFISVGLGFVFGNMYPVLQPFLSDDDEEGEVTVDEDIEGGVEGFSDRPEESIEIHSEIESTNENQDTESEESAGGVILPAPEEDYPELVEVARLFRDPHEYKLYAFIDGKLYIGIQGLDQEQQSALGVLVSELEGWLLADPDDNGGDASVPVILIKAPPLSPDQMLADSNENKDQQDSQKLSLNPLKLFENVVRDFNAKSVHKSRNIAEEINAILQENIADTPLVGHGLEVGNKADGSLAFIVGEEIYSSIDEIEDEEIRKALEQAVEQWDQS